ncbi:MAG TPA: hypothetical protein VGK19_20930 [Capsulimonadaceae bacterium]|jgi:hypothetical protein
MKLIDIIEDLDNVSEDLIIYAAPVGGRWTAESPAALVPMPEDGERLRRMGEDYEGMLYMIEVFLAKEVAEDWADRQNIAFLDEPTKLRVIVYYAEHDAYPPA